MFQTIGLGTKDSYQQAQLFAIRHSITFRMLWDSSFKSWQGFGISSQPAHILVTREGAKIKKWQGELREKDMEEVVRLARES